MSFTNDTKHTATLSTDSRNTATFSQDSHSLMGITWGSDFNTWAQELRTWAAMVSQFTPDNRN